VRVGGGSSFARQSGNPGGRSKAQIDARNAAREYTQEAIDTLVLVMRNGKPSEAAVAANSLLDRGWGKPREPVELQHPGADLSTLSDEELERIIGRRARRVV
jgi:hypothetical protein